MPPESKVIVFPDEHHGPVFFLPPRIFQDDEFRRLLASTRDAQHAAHSQFFLVLALEHGQVEAEFFGYGLRLLRHARGRHDVGRVIAQVPCEPRGVGTGFSPPGSRFHAADLIRTTRQQGHRPDFFRRFLIVGLIVREPVPAQHGALHHGLGDSGHRRLDGIGSQRGRGKGVRSYLPNLLACRAHGLSNAVQGHVLFLSQPQQKHSLGRKGLSRMNQYGLLILAGKLSGFPQLPELSAQRVIQRLMGPGQRVLVFIATDHEYVRGFLGNRTFLNLILHATLLSFLNEDKEPLLYCTIGRMAALCPRSTLTYLSDKPRVSLRDALPSIPLSP